MALIDKVKNALRISHDKLDEEISDNIEAARAEMIRLGISPALAYSDDPGPLTLRAIKTFCMASLSALDPNTSVKYIESFNYQVDCLRKSSAYVPGGDAE